MNAFTLVFVALLVFALAYRFYGLFIAKKVLGLDPSRPTPASVMEDGHDYHVTNKYVLFGHHFAAIAAAGPLIGPVLAAQFGYLPGALSAGPAPEVILNNYNIIRKNHAFDLFNTEQSEYYDDFNDYITNEPTISGNATALFVLGFYSNM